MSLARYLGLGAVTPNCPEGRWPCAGNLCALLRIDAAGRNLVDHLSAGCTCRLVGYIGESATDETAWGFGSCKHLPSSSHGSLLDQPQTSSSMEQTEAVLSPDLDFQPCLEAFRRCEHACELCCHSRPAIFHTKSVAMWGFPGAQGQMQGLPVNQSLGSRRVSGCLRETGIGIVEPFFPLFPCRRIGGSPILSCEAKHAAVQTKLQMHVAAS